MTRRRLTTFSKLLITLFIVNAVTALYNEARLNGLFELQPHPSTFVEGQCGVFYLYDSSIQNLDASFEMTKLHKKQIRVCKKIITD